MDKSQPAINCGLFLRPDSGGNHRDSTTGFRGRGCETLRPVRVGYGDYGIAVFGHWDVFGAFPISIYLEMERQERGDTSSTIYQHRPFCHNDNI